MHGSRRQGVPNTIAVLDVFPFHLIEVFTFTLGSTFEARKGLSLRASGRLLYQESLSGLSLHSTTPLFFKKKNPHLFSHIYISKPKRNQILILSQQTMCNQLPTHPTPVRTSASLAKDPLIQKLHMLTCTCHNSISATLRSIEVPSNPISAYWGK